MGCPPASDVGVVEMGVSVFVGLFVCFCFFLLQKGLHPWQALPSLDLIASAVLERGNLENLLRNILGKLNG